MSNAPPPQPPESDISKIVREVQARDKEIENFGKLSPLPDSFPRDFIPGIMPQVLSRLIEHANNMDAYSRGLNKYPLMDRVKTFPNIEAGHTEFHDVIVPILERYFGLYQPKTEVLDPGAHIVLNNALNSVNDITEEQKEIGSLVSQILQGYERFFYQIKPSILASLSEIISDLEVIVGDRVREVTGNN